MDTFADRGVEPSSGLVADDFILRPITHADAELDYEAVMESREYLRQWEQSTWPEDDFTVEGNLADMVTLEKRQASRQAYTYTVMKPDETVCFGCVYLSPPGVKWFADVEVTALTAHSWNDVDALLTFWVRRSKLAEQFDRRLLDVLLDWLDRDWAVHSPVMLVNEQFVQQVGMLDASDLERRFRFVHPTDPGDYLAYAR